MDLARYWRRFPQEDLSEVATEALRFVHERHIQDYWAEREEKKYALGFWAEALYQLYTLKPNKHYRNWLAETILKLEDTELGLPPSLLGANAETVPVKMQVPTPSLIDARLRVANLSRGTRQEFLIVNPTHESLSLAWDSDQKPGLVWQNLADGPMKIGASVEVPARGWVYGSKTTAPETFVACVSGS
jgi:hypothetical protein